MLRHKRKIGPGPYINRASRLIMRLGDMRLRPLGVAAGQVPVFAMLADGVQLTQKTLAETAQIEQPSMAQLLARMERDRLVERLPNPADKRSSLLKLTKLAEEKVPEIMKTLQRGGQQMLAGFTPEERDSLIHLLGRVVENLETAVAEELSANEE